MSEDPDIVDLQQRLAKAESDQSTWKASGNQEKFLESFFRVDALEYELDKVRKQKFEAGVKAAQFRPAAPPPEETRRKAPYGAAERVRLMAEYSITPSGRRYQYSHYRYDRFEDALAYARKQRVAPSASDAGDSLPPPQVEETQDDAQRKQMAGYGITFHEGVYSLGAYRYDRLADAMRYARLITLAEDSRPA